MKLSQKKIQQFQKEILDWYKKNKRSLIWRRDRDPYHILISEIMLQQTQVSRVIPKYEAWLQAFPDVETLANASTRDVLLHWSGLGYNRRALYLKKCAEEIHKSGWPKTEKELQKLSGIGEYTARAILCFAFNEQVAVVDTNVRRVILVKFQETINKIQINSKNQISNKEIQKIADTLLPKNRAYEWNQALMDYAASELRSHKIPIVKQSKFRYSDRYYRGQILKLLLTQSTITQTQLHKQFPTLATKRMTKILKSLRKDMLIKKNKTTFSLS